MAALYQCSASLSISSLVFFLCGLSLVTNGHSVNTRELSRDSANDALSNSSTPDDASLKGTFVFPRHGLTTGPPVGTFQDPTEVVDRTQRREPEVAHDSLDDSDVANATRINDSRSEGVVERISMGKELNQKLEDDPIVKTLPLKGSCLSGDSTGKGGKHPSEDTVALYEALGNILEHITGVEHHINDPEEIRTRAYVGERQSFGVQVILQEETRFWESSLEGDDVEPIKHFEEYIPQNTSRATPIRQEQYMSDQPAEEELGANITVKEGSRVRLVCNVSGVPTYWAEWRREANLSFPGGAAVVGGRSVLLDYVGREDAGIYVCTVATPSGHSHSSTVAIHVHYAPILGVWARDVETNRVEIGCLVEGLPLPSSAWYINNTKISPSHCPRNLEIRSTALSPPFVLSVLSLSNVSKENFAYYHCRATNAVGVSRAYVMLHDDTGVLDLHELAEMRPVKYPAPLENPRLSSFLLGMVPPLYIGLYIIAYLGCYKTSISGVGGHGRFGAGLEQDLVE